MRGCRYCGSFENFCLSDVEHDMCSTRHKPEAERRRDPLERALWYLGRLDYTADDVELARSTASQIRAALQDRLTPAQKELVDRALSSVFTLR